MPSRAALLGRGLRPPAVMVLEHAVLELRAADHDVVADAAHDDLVAAQEGAQLGGTLGDLYHDETKARCAMTARCTGQSVHRVQGWLRVLYNVSSVYRINAAFREVVYRQLESWVLGRMALPSRAVRQLKSVPADPAQRVLKFPDPPPAA